MLFLLYLLSKYLAIVLLSKLIYGLHSCQVYNYYSALFNIEEAITF